MKRIMLSLLAILLTATVSLATPLQDVFNDFTVSGTSSIDVTTDMIDDQSDSTWSIGASGGSIIVPTNISIELVINTKAASRCTTSKQVFVVPYTICKICCTSCINSSCVTTNSLYCISYSSNCCWPARKMIRASSYNHSSHRNGWTMTSTYS